MSSDNITILSRIGLCAILLGIAPGAGLAQTCTPFYDRAQFEDFNRGEGKSLEGIETCEESNIYKGGKQPLPAPLDLNPNTMGGIGFPTGLAQQNIAIWDNITPGPNPPDLNPSGSPFALYVIGPGFFGSLSKKVGGDSFVEGRQASLDLVFVEPRNSGVGFELSWFFFQAGWHVSIYDAGGQTIGFFEFQGSPSPEPSTSFFGVWCDQAIGRINVFDDAGPWPDAIANIQTWN